MLYDAIFYSVGLVVLLAPCGACRGILTGRSTAGMGPYWLARSLPRILGNLRSDVDEELEGQGRRERGVAYLVGQHAGAAWSPAGVRRESAEACWSIGSMSDPRSDLFLPVTLTRPLTDTQSLTATRHKHTGRLQFPCTL